MYRAKTKGKYELKLGEIRKARGLTQSELAALLGVTKQIVSNWEREVTPIDFIVAIQICDILKCSIEELGGREEIRHV